MVVMYLINLWKSDYSAVIWCESGSKLWDLKFAP